MKEFFVEKIADVWENSYSTASAVFATIFLVVLALGCVFGVMCFQAWLVMLLWNWVAVELFGLPVLGFWMAFGLRWLCGLLFRSNASTQKKSED